MYYSAIGLIAIFVLLIENHNILFGKNGTSEIQAGKEYRRFLFAVLIYEEEESF